MKVTLPVLMLCWSALAHAALPTTEERLEDVVAGEVSWQAALPELGPLGWADPEVLQARRLVLANSGTAQKGTEDDVLVSLMVVWRDAPLLSEPGLSSRLDEMGAASDGPEDLLAAAREKAWWRQAQHAVATAALGDAPLNVDLEPLMDELTVARASVSRGERVIALLHGLWPFMSPVDRDQALIMTQRWWREVHGVAWQDRLVKVEDPGTTAEEVAEIVREVAASHAHLAGIEDSAWRLELTAHLDVLEAIQSAAELRQFVDAADARAAALAAEEAEAARVRSQAQDAHPAVAVEAESRSRTAVALALAERWLGEAEDALNQRREAIAAALEELSENDARMVLSQSWQVDNRYGELRDAIISLRAECLGMEQERIRRWSELPEVDPVETRRTRVSEMAAETALHQAAIDGATEALSAEEAALNDLEDVGRRIFDAHLEVLRDAKAARQRYRPWVSSSQLQLDDDHFREDVLGEFRLLRPQLMALTHARRDMMEALPSRVFDPGWVREVAVGALLIGGLVLLWRILGATLPRRSRAVIGWVHRQGLVALRPVEQVALEAPTVRVLQRGVDALGVWTLGLMTVTVAETALVGTLPELSAVVEAIVWFYGFRFAFAVADLLLSEPDEPRPSVVLVSKEGHAAFRGVIRLAMVWLVGSWLLEAMLTEVLVAGAIARLVHWALQALGLLLVLGVAWNLEPRLRRRVQRLRTPVPWVDRLSEHPGRLPIPFVRGAIFGLMATAAAGWEMVTGGAAAALGAMVDRVRFSQAERVGRALTPDERAQIGQMRLPPDADAAGPVQTVLGVHAAWTEERRQGLVVLAADPGHGLEGCVEQVCEAFALRDWDVSTIAVDDRIDTPHGLVTSVLTSLGLEEHMDDLDAVVDRIESLPPRVLVLDGLHRGFLREAGGLQGLRNLMYVANASSNHHFWLVTSHRPAWRFFERLGALLNTGVVRRVVTLAPWSAPAIRALCEQAATEAGLVPAFTRLEGKGLFGNAPEIEREQTRRGFFRLLTEGCQGNPRGALQIWGRCLRRMPDGRVVVVIDPSIAGDMTQRFDAEDQFVLTALRLHGGLDMARLERCLEAGNTSARAVVHELEQRGVLARRGREFVIPLHLWASVTAELQRSSLVGKGDR